LFHLTIKYRFKTAEQHLNEWTPEERSNLSNCHKTCYDAFRKHAKSAEAQDKCVYAKEHTPWLIDPVAKTRIVFGENTIIEEPWMVRAMKRQVCIEWSETVLPDDVLRQWYPTFLIRHPALAFPSLYRTTMDLQGAEAAKCGGACQRLEMTMRWSRNCMNWYLRQFVGFNSSTKVNDGWPLILDVGDIMAEPRILERYGEIVGLDPIRFKSRWTGADNA